MSKAEDTIAKISEGMLSGQIAAIPTILHSISNMSLKLQDLAVQDLAQIVRNDTVVLERVIRAANTIGYNPSGIEITTLEEAIQVIGFDRVRSLTLSLVLLEESCSWQASDERKNAVLSSLSSGIMAEKLAESAGLNPDVVFISGALSGFGRIVMSTYMLDEYRQAEALAVNEDMPVDQAFKTVFGLTPCEIGHHLLKEARLSKIHLDSIQKFVPTTGEKLAMSPERRQQALVDFSNQLVSASLDSNVDNTAYQNQVKRLQNFFSPGLEFNHKEITQCTGETRKHLNALLGSTGHQHMPMNITACLQSRVEMVNPPVTKKAKPKLDTALPQKMDEKVQKTVDAGQTKAFEDAISQFKELAKDKAILKQAALDSLVNSICKGLKADECWLFLKMANRPYYRYKSGIGAYGMVLESKGMINPHEKSIFSLCLNRKENIFINNIQAPRIREHIPKWYLNNIQLRSFILLCLKDEQHVHGLIFAGWRQSGEAEIHPEHTKLIHQLLSYVADLKLPQLTARI